MIRELERQRYYHKLCMQMLKNRCAEEIKNLSDVLEKYVDEETKQKIVQEYLLQLIPVESAI